MIAVRMVNALGAGELVYANGRMVNSGEDLETAIVMMLETDAPAGDAKLPQGTPDRGFWGDAFDGYKTGSRLWLLDDAVASEENAQRAKTYALEALQSLVTDGRVKAIDATPQLVDGKLTLYVAVTKLNGEIVTLGPFGPFGAS